jgi:hypothetical protein
MRRALILLGLLAASLPASAQSIRSFDPDSAIDADLNRPQTSSQPPQQQAPIPTEQPVDPGSQVPAETPAQPPAAPAPTAQGAALVKPEAPATFDRVQLLSAAEGVFGKGATGLAALIEDILKDQGQPNAYIAGSEGSGALVVGLRYGSGQMVHAIEGERKVFWTGPSVGFDMGGDANKVFVLVYNLYDSQELYKRFPAGEGRVYFVGGFSATYLRRGDVVLIPVRLGVGWRVGANVGYMKFSEKSRWFPF